MDITSTTSILVQVADNTVANLLTNNSQATDINFQSGTINTTLSVSSFTNYVISVFLLTTQTPHNYSLTDVNSNIKLYNTQDPLIPNDTNYDGVYEILQIPNNTSIVLPGSLTNVKTN